MAESQGSPRRILAAKFFDKVAEIDQIANTALANSNALQSELSNVQMDLRSLIESLQVDFDSGVQNIQNQINEVTNVIIQEQDIRKVETETLQEQIFAQEDQLQKDVKGKKAKKVAPDSFAGKMRQKLRDKAKENSGVLGLLGASAGLTAISSFNFGDDNKDGDGAWWKPWTWNKGDEDDKEETNEEITEGNGDGDNNNTEFTEFSEENPPKGLRRVLTGLVDFVMFGATDMDYRGDLFGGGEEIKDGINTYGDGEEIKDGINTYGDGDEISSNTNNEQIIGANSGFRHVTNTKVDNMQFGLGNFVPGGGKGGSTYGDPDYNLIQVNNTTDNNSNNEVIDGGTTVIEGDTQVVDGGTTGKKRGEVATSTNLVKSANSSVVVINFAESNSQKELSVGV